MGKCYTIAVLATVVCLGATVFGEQTFSSRRTYESETSVYRRGAYTTYGHGFTPRSVSAYAGVRILTGSSMRRRDSYPMAAGLRRSRGRLRRPSSSSSGEWELKYSATVTAEEEVSWSGEPPRRSADWRAYRYPAYNYYNYYDRYSLPYCLGPYYYYAYRGPIGHRLRPSRPRGFRSYYYPHAGSGIDVRTRW